MLVAVRRSRRVHRRPLRRVCPRPGKASAYHSTLEQALLLLPAPACHEDCFADCALSGGRDLSAIPRPALPQARPHVPAVLRQRHLSGVSRVHPQGQREMADSSSIGPSDVQGGDRTIWSGGRHPRGLRCWLGVVPQIKCLCRQNSHKRRMRTSSAHNTSAFAVDFGTSREVWGCLENG